MKKKQENLSKIAFMCCLAAILTFSKKETKEVNVSSQMIEEIDETQKTLDLYNNNLKKENITLTQEDIKYLSEIRNNNTICLKSLDGNYYKAKIEYEYKILEKNNNIYLICNPRYKKIDLFTNKEIDYTEEEYNNAIDFREYFNNINISEVGYTFIDSWECSSSERKKVSDKYPRKITEKISKIGLPVPIYDVKDFYKPYEKNNKKIAKIAKKYDETEKTLNKYNTYLKKVDIQITKEDIYNIVSLINNNRVIIKSDKYYMPLDLNENYKLLEQEDRINLISKPHWRQEQMDLFTRTPIIYTNEEYANAIEFEEYISDIPIKGYGLIIEKRWTKEEKEAIIRVCGPDFWEHGVKELGLPMPVYDIEDIYNNYEDSKILRLTK